MSPNVVLPLCSSIVSFVFAAAVLAQWSARRRAFQLVWAVGLLWYGISAGTEFLGSAFGWTEPLYRTWYLIGAFFVAAYLGAGTVVLLARTRFGYFVGVSFLIGALYAFAIRGRYPNDTLAFAVVLLVCLGAGLAVPERLSGSCSECATPFLTVAIERLVVPVLEMRIEIEPPIGSGLVPPSGEQRFALEQIAERQVVEQIEPNRSIGSRPRQGDMGNSSDPPLG